MLQFNLCLIRNAPESVRHFVHKNLFQRNQNRKNQNTAEGIDYKLEEFNKLFKNFEVSAAPSIDEWTRIASAAPKYKKIMEQQAQDYNIEWGFYSEPGPPDYNE